jgi:ADP-ribose pyrophosphatase
VKAAAVQNLVFGVADVQHVDSTTTNASACVGMFYKLVLFLDFCDELISLLAIRHNIVILHRIFLSFYIGGYIVKLIEKTLSSKEIFNGKVLHITLDEVELTNGKQSKREVVNHPGGVAVAALDDDNNLLFVKQFRYPYKEVVLELPAGKLEKGSTPLENGKRELLEETGAVGYSYISLGQVYPSPGYTSEIIHLYACRVKSLGESRPDDGEFLNVEKIPLSTAVEMVLNNQIPDSKTQIAILKTAMLIKSGKI